MADPDNPDSESPSLEAPHHSAGVVLVADRTAGSEELAAALRDEGLSVLHCDIIALPERASRFDPFAVVVDIEQPNAAPAVTRLLEMSDEKTVIAAVGTLEVARRLNLATAERARLFRRPLVISEVVSFLREMAKLDDLLGKVDAPSGAGSEPEAGTGAGTGIGTGAGPASGTGPGHADSESILVSDFPAFAGMPEVEGILPELDDSAISTKLAGQLSPEIEALLASSAQKVRDQDRELSRPMPEPNVLVPPDMLALVDDLLNSEEQPATRGGMDLAAMLASTSASNVGDPPPAASSHSAALDSRPSWRTGVPDPAVSDVGSAPTGLASDDGESTGLADRDRESEPPGTSIGLGEETSVPGGGTQVGHSSPLEPGPAPAAHPSEPATGSSPPEATELLAQMRGDSRTRPLTNSDPPSEHPPSFQPSDVPGGSSPPPRTEHYTARRPGGPVHIGSDSPPESVLAATSELAPMTTAGSPLFSSRRPVSRENAMPIGAVAPPPSSTEALASSRDGVRGDPYEMLAGTVRQRITGALMLSSADGTVVRRILMRDGDMVNAASEHEDDALIHFLVGRGDLSPEVAQMRSARLPHTGRHAAAALIANGFLGQDDLWPVLRAHAEWIIARALAESPAIGVLEREPPERLRAEPNVFGGAAGVEVFVEAVCRVLSNHEALARLGGPDAVLGEGTSLELLAESALSAEQRDRIRGGVGQRLAHVLEPRLPGFEAVLFALVSLHILTSRAPSRRPEPAAHPEVDPLDADAVRQRVAARVALVHEADYFSLLGVPPAATGYEIRRAFVDLRRVFEPARLLTAATSDLHDDVTLIVEVLEEAYQILRDPNRRSRYRRALEAAGPARAHP